MEGEEKLLPGPWEPESAQGLEGTARALLGKCPILTVVGERKTRLERGRGERLGYKDLALPAGAGEPQRACEQG